MVSLETVLRDSRWVAKMQGYREVGTYDEIGHLFHDEDCRDFDLCAEQPEHLEEFYNRYWMYPGFITVQDFYNRIENPVTIPRKDFDRLVGLAMHYDPFTQYIDNYEQEKAAEEANKYIIQQFNEVATQYIGATVWMMPDAIENKGRETAKALKEWLNAIGVAVEGKRTWTDAEIRELLTTNDEFVRRALKKLYERQTDSEKSGKSTHVENGEGFNKVDAEVLSGICEWMMAHGRLSDKQLALVRKRIMKYSKQLTRIANDQ